MIYVQIGHHSRINELGQSYEEKDYDDFEKDFRCFIEYLKQYTDNIILLGSFYSVIPNKHIQSIENSLLKKEYMKWLQICGYKEKKMIKLII